MKIAGIDFQKPILDALRDGRLVVFAGAGVSMGEPANLPNFRDLAKAIAQGSDKSIGEGEPEDRFLGRLKDEGIDVCARTRDLLSQCSPQPTSLHKDLLRLSLDPDSVRVVTTNFDLLFEWSTSEVFYTDPEVFTAPALPLGSNFKGIVHVHGSLNRAEHMVLTDSDFGRAYLTEGWARRFLVDVFSTYIVLFIGYSHNDVVMNYLARALPTGADRYALTDSAGDTRWQSLGIQPIPYEKGDDGNHASLYMGVEGLANHVRRGILDWQQEIRAIAEKEPPLEGEDSDLIEAALSDVALVSFFTDAARDSAWIDWLERRGHLDNLFAVSPDELSERDNQLGIWLATRFAHADDGEIFHLIARHELQIHRDFWFAILRSIAFANGQKLKPTVLARWVSVLLESLPPVPYPGLMYSLLAKLGGRCSMAGLTNSLLDIFAEMATNHLEISSLKPYFDDPDTDISMSIGSTIKPTGPHSSLEELWLVGLKPNLDQLAVPLLRIAVQSLSAQNRMSMAWRVGGNGFGFTGSYRGAIESHEQDKNHEAINVAIDVARDCLEYLAKESPIVASQWCDLLIREDAALLRRLAIHILSVRQDLVADEKIEWLLSNISLHDISSRHEIFQFLLAIYPQAGMEKRKAVLDAVFEFEWPDSGGEDADRRNYYSQLERLEWLYWLQKADPNCQLVQARLRALARIHPDFQPSEYPDLLIYSSIVETHPRQSPLSVAELVSRPAREWVGELLTFQEDFPLRPNREDLLKEVADAATEEFQWGIDLANALIASGNWDSDIWPHLIQAWSQELDVHKHRRVLGVLNNEELHVEYARPVADALVSLVKDGRLPYAVQLLDDASRVAATLWSSPKLRQSTYVEYDWLFRAMNHPAGVLTEFWLHSISVWLNGEDSSPRSFEAQYREALSTIVEDQTYAGSCGKAVLTSRLVFMLHNDETWTRTHLIPIFTSADDDGYQPVWHGLVYGRISLQAGEALKTAFIQAITEIESLFPQEDSHQDRHRQQFVDFYAHVVTYFVDEPLDLYIPKFFQSTSTKDRGEFSRELGRYFRQMDDARRKEWWDRWLKRYWENRLQGVPKPLEGPEVEEFVNSLPYFGSFFPEAVELAIQMPAVCVDRRITMSILLEEKVWLEFPESTAKIVDFIVSSEQPPFVWYLGKTLIGKLLSCDLPSGLRTSMREILAQMSDEST